MEVLTFINYLTNEDLNRIRNSKSDAEARRLLREHQALQLQKEQDKKIYSEEEILKYVDYYEKCYAERPTKKPLRPNEWFEQFKNK